MSDKSLNSSKRLLSDSSSLVDLKAEVFRKHQEAKFNKSHGQSQVTDTSTSAVREQVDKKDAWSKKNIGLTQKETKDREIKQREAAEAARVKEALERKAQLYQKLKEKEGHHEGEDRFLVRFGQQGEDDEEDVSPSKEYPAANEGEEWVEYVDALGRTRTCMKRDLQDLKKQDEELGEAAKIHGHGQHVDEVRDAHRGMPDLLSEDMRREMLRQVITFYE